MFNYSAMMKKRQGFNGSRFDQQSLKKNAKKYPDILQMKIAYNILLIMFLIPCTALGFSVRAQVDRNIISINESMNLKIIFEDGEGKVDTSPIQDFDIVSTSSSSNISIINGKASRTMSTIFRLVPLKSGVLSIPSLEVVHKKKVYHTKEITIEVSETKKSRKQARDIFVEAGLSSDVLYTGQQGIYQLRLYSAVQYSNARLQQPSFQGFNAKEAGERKNYTETINGRTYNVIEINYVIIPETTGDIEIAPAVITCEVRVRGGRSPFDDSFFSNNFFSFGRTEPRRLATQSLQVKVKPLPEYNGNTPFSGLVGRFSLKTGLDRTTLKAGESATLTIIVSGTGNLMDAQAPHISIPSEFKVYDDTPEENISLTLNGYSGTKTFKLALVPVKPGSYPLNPLSLTYYDTAEKQYKTLATGPIVLNVEKADDQGLTTVRTDNQTSGSGSLRNLEKKDVAFTGRDILALKEGPEALINKRTMPITLFALLFFLPCFVFYLLKAFLVFGNKDISSSAILAKKARLNLKQAEKQDIDQNEFLRSMHGALSFAVLSKKGTPGQSVTPDEVPGILSGTRTDEGVAKKAADLLYDIESARYGTRNMDEFSRKELLRRLKDILKFLAISVFLCAAFSILPGNIQADDSGTFFLQGISDYKSENFTEAAKAFEQVAKNGVCNGHLFYNIGNAWLKAGDIGRAMLWYERAKKLIPLDPDLKFNLDYTRGLVQDKLESPGVDVSGIVFFWKDYLPARAAAFAAIFVSVVFFSYAGFRTIRKKKVFTLAGVFMLLILVFSGSTAFYDYYAEQNHDRAVIIAGEASVRSGLSLSATELFVLHPGTIVRVESIKNGYLKIFFSKGKMGWVSKDDIELI